MPYKYIFLVVAFYFIFLVQSSFFSHFYILGATPNLLLILVCLLSFIEPAQSRLGIVSAITAGIFLDVSNSAFIGISVLALLLVYFFIKKALVYLMDFSKKYSVLYFIPILLVSTIFYELIINIFISLASRPILLHFPAITILCEVLFNVILGTVGFYIFKLISGRKYEF